MKTAAEYLPTRFWLMKTEPDVFAFEDLFLRPGQRETWDGVRNYQARNFMRDSMQIGHWVLIYHSNAQPPGVAGLARVVECAIPDASACDSSSPYYDAKATPQNPRWCCVTVGQPLRLPRFLPLSEMKEMPELQEMLLLRPGQRLSVQPIGKPEFFEILKRVGMKVQGELKNEQENF